MKFISKLGMVLVCVGLLAVTGCNKKPLPRIDQNKIETTESVDVISKKDSKKKNRKRKNRRIPRAVFKGIASFYCFSASCALAIAPMMPFLVPMTMGTWIVYGLGLGGTTTAGYQLAKSGWNDLRGEPSPESETKQ